MVFAITSLLYLFGLGVAAAVGGYIVWVIGLVFVQVLQVLSSRIGLPSYLPALVIVGVIAFVCFSLRGELLGLGSGLFLSEPRYTYTLLEAFSAGFCWIAPISVLSFLSALIMRGFELD